MARVDPLLLVVSRGVPCQLEDLGGQVLHDCSQVDGGAGTHSLGVVALTEETVDSADGELEPRAGRTTLSLGAGLASFTTSGHDDCCFLGFSERFLSKNYWRFSSHGPCAAFLPANIAAKVAEDHFWKDRFSTDQSERGVASGPHRILTE